MLRMVSGGAYGRPDGNAPSSIVRPAPVSSSHIASNAVPCGASAKVGCTSCHRCAVVTILRQPENLNSPNGYATARPAPARSVVEAQVAADRQRVGRGRCLEDHQVRRNRWRGRRRGAPHRRRLPHPYRHRRFHRRHGSAASPAVLHARREARRWHVVAEEDVGPAGIRREAHRVGDALRRPAAVLVLAPGELDVPVVAARRERLVRPRHGHRRLILLLAEDRPDQHRRAVPDDGDEMVALDVEIDLLPRRPGLRRPALAPVEVDVRRVERAAEHVHGAVGRPGTCRRSRGARPGRASPGSA